MAWLIPKILRPSVRAQKRALKEVKRITNEMILAELDAIFLETNEALNYHKHKVVINVLKYLILHDLELRRIIGNLVKGDISVSAATLTDIIELQSHYNLFRTNLMVEIVNVLLEGYNETINSLSINYDYSMDWYKYTKRLNDYYLREIRKFLGHRDADEYQYRIYDECMHTFEEVHRTANESIRKLINIQLRVLQQ